ncbi:hypothetical protein [Streptomyces sp. NPDC012888]|uniref:hypothetical protein n=1 Tax=Streptomyces sp. NPDC012888 TaxID=3364855 RepID=UPI00368DAD03
MTAPIRNRTGARPRGPVQATLPWWALALPTLAFGLLFALLGGTGGAGAAPHGTALTQLVETALHALAG